ncbi:MAG: cytochrome-c peroxidase [Sediminibacterium sp.]
MKISVATTITVVSFAALCMGTTAIFSYKPTPIRLLTPKGWPTPAYNFSSNPLTKEGIALGKKLFYDPALSSDSSVSCATCHEPTAAFTTYDHPLSHGVNNLTTRNAPSLFNVAWQKELMYDGRAASLEAQALLPLHSIDEMDANMPDLLKQLNNNPTYKKMFSAAFGPSTITQDQLTRALSQFQLTLVSANSKYDQVMRGEASFILPEKLGYEIFEKKCVSCHTPPLFTNYSYQNTAITRDPVLKDNGRARFTGNSTDSLKFKVPSLRNVALTFPYGHDGRYYSILSVLTHYKTSGQIPLSNYEIGQLTAFLNTLTDSSALTNPAFLPAQPVINNKIPNHTHQ